jgi:hypothetical protein
MTSTQRPSSTFWSVSTSAVDRSESIDVGYKDDEKRS